MTERGHRASDWLVRRMLRAAGYSLQGNAKTAEGRQHPDRDAQFGYLNEQASAPVAAGQLGGGPPRGPGRRPHHRIWPYR